ncbi:hypothetical protein HYH03_012004 [Edaphochlamys debaryana]|uniref:Uncharacterized protein n=1 Tax=Edaphochlamys debaryana TaxID=47281 RepID=A0A836BVY5_9CHLO|nr:hypothetical protein HYH03_012004 [Edaphochlamys debaryana]|eukprot:KAG2489553.1 hypothetical protein HYH03_012004 [Edaphochlamys debaryana]
MPRDRLDRGLWPAGLSDTAEAGKYNISQTQQWPGLVSHIEPGAPCDPVAEPGTCVPMNVTINPNTLWYWCGFYTSHRTIYNIKSNGNSNITQVWLVRQQVLDDCFIPNIGTLENCPVVPESSCSKKKTCNVRIFGLVFEDPGCIVILNNGVNPFKASVQVNNYYDRPRYYGTVFTIIFCVCGFSAILIKLGYDFYTGCATPVNAKHTESVKVKRPGNDLQEALLDGQPDAEKGAAAEAATAQAEASQGPGAGPFARFTVRIKGAFTRQPRQEP